MVNQIGLSSFITKFVFFFISWTIKKESGYDVLRSNEPIKMIKNVKCPCYFTIGEEDNLVDLIEFAKMYEKCPSEQKTLKIMEWISHSSFWDKEDLKHAV